MKQEMMAWHCYRLDHIQIICTSLQIDDYVQRKRVSDLFGTFRWTAFPSSNLTIQKVKFYSGLIHLLESFGRETNFGTLLKNGMMFKTRVSQGNLLFFKT